MRGWEDPISCLPPQTPRARDLRTVSQEADPATPEAPEFFTFISPFSTLVSASDWAPAHCLQVFAQVYKEGSPGAQDTTTGTPTCQDSTHPRWHTTTCTPHTHLQVGCRPPARGTHGDRSACLSRCRPSARAPLLQHHHDLPPPTPLPAGLSLHQEHLHLGSWRPGASHHSLDLLLGPTDHCHCHCHNPTWPLWVGGTPWQQFPFSGMVHKAAAPA